MSITAVPNSGDGSAPASVRDGGMRRRYRPQRRSRVGGQGPWQPAANA